MVDLEVLSGLGSVPADGFEVMYRTDAGEVRLDLEAAWRAPIESGLPVRSFRPYKAQRHFQGQWWSATDERLVGYESWLERDHVMLLDFDPAVTAISSRTSKHRCPR